MAEANIEDLEHIRVRELAAEQTVEYAARVTPLIEQVAETNPAMLPDLCGIIAARETAPLRPGVRVLGYLGNRYSNQQSRPRLGGWAS